MPSFVFSDGELNVSLIGNWLCCQFPNSNPYSSPSEMTTEDTTQHKTRPDEKQGKTSEKKRDLIFAEGE